ncbi:FliH/SctL family protein [Heliomicrobium modesticaldum]|uniref:FliH/SctL family protein n=1 Tax=Heliomicrobium modesticaldum TaxID=35701 RepID=UPI00030D02C6|nr:FliH/SctL family protein [Heliomicrobium modesticaldum]
MSRVIKSAAFRAESPKVLEVFLPISPAGPLTEEPPTPPLEPEETVEAQAERVLEETRQAVQELMIQAREQANAIIAEARQSAAAVVAAAEQEGEAIRRRHAEEGYQFGVAQGLEAARQEAEAIVAEAWREAEAARQAKAAYIDNTESEMVELAITIAEKILAHEIANRQDVVVHIAANALKKVRDMSAVILKVNPQDYPLIQSIKPELMAMVRGLRTLAVEQDETVSPGGCVIETNHGYVDARIDAQLEEVRRVIREVMHG